MIKTKTKYDIDLLSRFINFEYTLFVDYYYLLIISRQKMKKYCCCEKDNQPCMLQKFYSNLNINNNDNMFSVQFYQ